MFYKGLVLSKSLHFRGLCRYAGGWCGGLPLTQCLFGVLQLFPAVSVAVLFDRVAHYGKGRAVVHLNSSRQTLERTLATPGRGISVPIKKCDSAFRSVAMILIT